MNCNKCNSEYTYSDGVLQICSECGFEWNLEEVVKDDDALLIKDAHGTLLQEGDTVTLIKDLKIKGSNDVVKQGTKVKGIRLVGGDHDIDAKVPGFGQMGLKSEFVKKVT